MSNFHEDEYDREVPSLEPWLKVAVSSFLPTFLGFLVPSELRIWCFVATGAVMAVALVMLGVQLRRARNS